MLPALLLALAGQAPAPDGLALEPPHGWQRLEDGQKRYYALVPPGVPPGQTCAVLVLVPLDFEGTPDEWHDVAVRNASQGSQILGEVKKSAAGSFKVSTFSQRTAAGPLQWLSVHTIRWGKRGQSVVHASTDERLFAKHAPEVLALVEKARLPEGAAPPPAVHDPAPAVHDPATAVHDPAPGEPAASGAAPGAVPIAGLLIPVPPSWARREDPSGWTVLTLPPAPFTEHPQVWIGPSQRIQGGHWAAHRALLKSMAQSLGWPGSNLSHNPAGPGPFIMSDASSSVSLAGAFKLFTAIAGDRIEAVVVSPLGLRGVPEDIYSVLGRTTLSDPRGALKPPTVVEAYRRPAMKSFINIDGSMFHGQVKYERILLLSNGAADFVSRHEGGYAASPEVAKVDPELLNGFYGRWKADGNTIRIQRQADQTEQVYQRESGSLRLGDQVWTAIPRVDGLKLKGRYAYRSNPGDPLQYEYWLDFTEEGGFRTGGALAWLALTDATGRPKPLETVSGTYEIRDWTIWFKVDGKVAWSTDFMTLKDDPKDLSTVLIETFGFRRE